MGLGAQITNSSICFKVTPENTEEKDRGYEKPSFKSLFCHTAQKLGEGKKSVLSFAVSYLSRSLQL